MQIPLNAVVVSRNIHVCKGISCLHIAAVKCCSGLHEAASQHSGQIVKELAADRFLFFLSFLSLVFLCLFHFFLRLFIAVDAEAYGT